MPFVVRFAVGAASVEAVKSTCANNCVPARNPLGYVDYYAPALACKLRLLASPKGYAKTRVLHHI
jgi:hypothetical protein